MLTESYLGISYNMDVSVIESEMMQLQESFSFDDNRELFDIALKYSCS